MFPVGVSLHVVGEKYELADGLDGGIVEVGLEVEVDPQGIVEPGRVQDRDAVGAILVQPQGRFAVDEGQSLQGCPSGFGGAAFVALDAADVDAGATGGSLLGESGVVTGMDQGLGV